MIMTLWWVYNLCVCVYEPTPHNMYTVQYRAFQSSRYLIHTRTLLAIHCFAFSLTTPILSLLHFDIIHHDEKLIRIKCYVLLL